MRKGGLPELVLDLVDAGLCADLILLAAGVNTFENSWKKAYTSRTFRTPSGKFAENVGQNPVAGQLFLANITAARGALPIMIGEETIGAVGVSGAPGGDKDEVCAQAGIDKVKDQLR